MKVIHASDDQAFLGHLQNVLENEGIQTFIKGQYLSGGIGEIPPVECWQRLCLPDDTDYDRAMRILAPILDPVPGDQHGWRCQCGEELEAQFASCWHCGELRPD